MKPALNATFTKRFPGGPEIRVEGLRLGGGGSGVTVLFGPSGSGKTTVLRCLAGLEAPDEGVIRFGDEVWFDAAAGRALPPRDRNLGFVPQDYALFPHLTVAANIGYGLRGLGREERASRSAEAIRWLGLDGLEARLPAGLSGGQQQRVALARAVVRRPQLLLLDEPFSALDTPTRQRLRSELEALLGRLQIPAMLVTHDRMEAAVLGDSIVVLGGGRILQSGSVEAVFNRPASLEAARILGTDTVVECDVISIAEGLVTLAAGEARLTALAGALPPGARRVHVCIRAEDVILTREADAHTSSRNRLRGTVTGLVDEGALVRVEVDCGLLLKVLLTRQACAELELRAGEAVTALVKAPHIHLL
jgi:molybdate transport system ATP-binding protein